MSPRFAVTAYLLILLLLSSLGSAFSQTPTPTASPNPGSFSPDKKWEYVGGDTPKLVKAGTNEVALQFFEDCDLGAVGKQSSVLWAPDSRRLAFYSCGVGKEHLTLLYQLRADRWVALKTPTDELSERVGEVIERRAKGNGLPKKTNLHMHWWEVKPRQWLDSSTLIVYAEMNEAVYRNDGEYVDNFGAYLLFTLKFDDAGNWKIIKTHQMSEKEVEEEQ